MTVVPLLFVVLGGFRTTAQINDEAGRPARPVGLDNYRHVLTRRRLLAGVWQQRAHRGDRPPALAVGLGAMAAFALSRYAFRGREALYTLFTLGLLFPLGVAILPLYLLLRDLGLLETPARASRSRRRRSRCRSRS